MRPPSCPTCTAPSTLLISTAPPYSFHLHPSPRLVLLDRSVSVPSSSLGFSCFGLRPTQRAPPHTNLCLKLKDSPANLSKSTKVFRVAWVARGVGGMGKGWSRDSLTRLASWLRGLVAMTWIKEREGVFFKMRLSLLLNQHNDPCNPCNLCTMTFSLGPRLGLNPKSAP